MTADELREHARAFGAEALRTGMVIAAAIGLHNFAEGLAIGVSAQAGEIGLATVLIIGFALHNSTDGFGIIGPLGLYMLGIGFLLGIATDLVVAYGGA